MSLYHCVIIPFGDELQAKGAASDIGQKLGYTHKVTVLDFDNLTVPPALAESGELFFERALDLPSDMQKRLYRLLYNAGNRL